MVLQGSRTLMLNSWLQSQCARFSSSSSRSQEVIDFGVAFSTVQRLQHIQETLQDAVTILRTNTEISNGLKALEESLSARGFRPNRRNPRVMLDKLQICVSRFRQHQSMAEDTMGRAKAISLLVRSLYTL